jgi:hypothetical protein
MSHLSARTILSRIHYHWYFTGEEVSCIRLWLLHNLLLTFLTRHYPLPGGLLPEVPCETRIMDIPDSGHVTVHPAAVQMINF